MRTGFSYEIATFKDKNDSSYSILKLPTHLNSSNREELEMVITDILTKTNNILFDFQETKDVKGSFISSVEKYDKVLKNNNGKMAFFNIHNSKVSRTFDLLDFESVKRFDYKKQAINYFKNS